MPPDPPRDNILRNPKAGLADSFLLQKKAARDFCSLAASACRKSAVRKGTERKRATRETHQGFLSFSIRSFLELFKGPKNLLRLSKRHFRQPEAARDFCSLAAFSQLDTPDLNSRKCWYYLEPVFPTVEPRLAGLFPAIPRSLANHQDCRWRAERGDIPMRKQFCRELCGQHPGQEIFKEFSEKVVSRFKRSAWGKRAFCISAFVILKKRSRIFTCMFLISYHICKNTALSCGVFAVAA